MPLVMIDTIREQYDEAQLRTLLDTVHHAVVEGFQVPATDRYQILTQHEPYEFVALDTDLGIQRSQKLIFVRLTSKARTQQAKEAPYRLIADGIEEKLGTTGSDVIITVTENSDADWSFGHGTAQFLTGDLS